MEGDTAYKSRFNECCCRMLAGRRLKQSLLVFNSPLSDFLTGSSVNVGCWMLDAGCWMILEGLLVHTIHTDGWCSKLVS